MNAMKARHHVRLITFLAMVSLFAPGVARTDDATDAAKMTPADAATHGQPMKMNEPMPTKMKKDGMMKENVMEGEMMKKKIMDETLKQEESTMEKNAK
jgi:hypothetical protein